MRVVKDVIGLGKGQLRIEVMRLTEKQLELV